MIDPAVFDEVIAEKKKSDLGNTFKEVLEDKELETPIENLQTDLSKMLEKLTARYSLENKRKLSTEMTSNLKDFIVSEISRIKPLNIEKIIERTIEKQVVKNIQVPVEMPPQIIKEVPNDFLNKIPTPEKIKEIVSSIVSSKINKLKETEQIEEKEEQKIIEGLKAEIESLKKTMTDMVNVLPLLTSHGGPGVRPLPDPSGKSGLYLTTDGTDFKFGNGSPFYIGNNWRIIEDGNNLSFQNLVAGIWVEAYAVTPNQ